MNPTLVRHFQCYADYHRHPMNRLTHKIAIPLIVFHVVAMLDWIPLFTLPLIGLKVTAAHVLYAFAVHWYWSLDHRLAVVMAIAFGVCFPLGWLTPPGMVWMLAIVAWAIQLAGHVVWEKRQPAFLTNLTQALIGPMFFAAVLMGEWPRRGTGD